MLYDKFLNLYFFLRSQMKIINFSSPLLRLICILNWADHFFLSRCSSLFLPILFFSLNEPPLIRSSLNTLPQHPMNLSNSSSKTTLETDFFRFRHSNRSPKLFLSFYSVSWGRINKPKSGVKLKFKSSCVSYVAWCVAVFMMKFLSRPFPVILFLLFFYYLICFEKRGNHTQHEKGLKLLVAC